MTDSGIDTAPVRLSPGDPAPEFTLPDADGAPSSLPTTAAGGSSSTATPRR